MVTPDHRKEKTNFLMMTEKIYWSQLFGFYSYVCHCVNRVPKEPATEMTPTSGCSSSSMRTVYIKNLSPTVDSVFLKITCSPYGDVANVKVIHTCDCVGFKCQGNSHMWLCWLHVGPSILLLLDFLLLLLFCPFL